jgi:uncharacterized membrane protein YfcA
MSKTRVTLICLAVIATIVLLAARFYGYVDRGTPSIVIGLAVSYTCIYFWLRQTARGDQQKRTGKRS